MRKSVVYGLIFIVMISVVYGQDCTDIDNTLIAYYSMDNDCITDDQGVYNLSLSGDPTHDTGDKPWGIGSCDFDGSGDYLQSTALISAYPPTTAKTMTFWVNFSLASGGGETPISMSDCSGGANQFWSVQNRPTDIYRHQVEQSTLKFVDTGTVDLNQWHFMALVIDDDGVIIGTYIDGTDTGGAAGTNTLVDIDTFTIGGVCRGSSTVDLQWNGKVTQVGIWDDQLNSTEVGYLYNTGSGCDPVTPPVQDPTLVLSSNIVNDDKIGFLDFSDGVYLFNVSGVSTNNTNIYNVSILINGTINKTYSDLDLSSANELNWTFTNIEAMVNLTISASNTNASDSLSYDVYFDGVNPDYETTLINNTVYYIDYDTDQVLINHTASDNNLFAVNYTIYNSTGSQIYSYTNQSLSGLSPYTVNWSLNLSSYNPDRYEVRAEVWDSHTKTEIDPDSYDIKYKLDGVDIDGVNIYGDDVEKVKLTFDLEKKDKFKFDVDFKTKSIIQYLWINDTSDLIFIPENVDGFKGHFVSTRTHRWVDFMSPQVQSVDVYPALDEENTYILVFNLYTDAKTISFESIGDLNLKNVSNYFNVSESFRFYAVDGITNTTINSFDISLTNGTYTHNYSTSTGTLPVNVTSGQWNATISATNYVGNSTVLNLSIDGSYTFYLTTDKSLYLFFYDELTDALIDDRNVSVDVINFENESFSYETATGSRFISGFATGNYEIRYTADGYNPRTYYVYIADQTTQSLRLYLLNESVASYIAFSIQDETGNYLENATVSATRFYVSCNCYRVVEMDKANFQGEAVFSLQKFDTRYNFIVVYNGLTVYSSSAGYKLTDDTYQLPVSLLGDTTQSYFTVNRDIYQSLSYNNATKLITFTVNDPTSLVDHFCVVADQMQPLSDAGYLNICNNCLTATTGSVTCNITDYYDDGREIIAKGFIETNTTYSSYWTDVLSIVTDTTGRAVTGVVGVFLAFLITFTVSMIGFSIGGIQLAILGLDLGLVVSRIVGILDLGLAPLTSIIGVSFIIIYLIGERS